MFKSRLSIIIILSLLALATALLRLQTYHEPIEKDNALYAVIGRYMTHGHLLYKDLVENKPPAIYVVYAVGEKIFGQGPLSIYMLGFIPACLTLVGIFLVVKKLTGNNPSSLWAACSWVVVHRHLMMQANQPNTEVFINACLVWAFWGYLHVRDRSFKPYVYMGIGLLLAGASLFKTVVILYVIAWSVCILPLTSRDKNKWMMECKKLICMGVIALGIWFLIFAYFAIQHRLQDFMDVVFHGNHTYAGSVFINWLVGLKPEFLFSGLFFPLIPLIVGFGVGICSFYVKRFSSNERMLCGYLLATPFVVSMPGKFYAHYYQYWLPILCLGSAWGIWRVGECLRWSTRIRFFMNLTLVFSLLCLQLPSLLWTGKEVPLKKYGELYGNQLLVTEDAAKRIEQILTPSETFYLWGVESELYYYMRRIQPLGIRFKWFLTNPPNSEKFTRMTLEELHEFHPELFVILDREYTKEIDHPVYQWCLEHFEPFPEALQQPPFLFFYRRGGSLEKRLSQIM